MNLQTQIPLSQKEPQINYKSKVLLLGSCFTENIGEKLDYFKFQNTQNPFGIIFNPVSIEKLVFRALNEDFFTEKDIFQHNELWHCFEAHSSLSGLDKDEVLHKLNLQLKAFRKQLTEATHIVVTLGSAWVYGYNLTGEIVANCHKVPQKEFSKELLSIDVISKSLKNCIAEIQVVNSKATFIFTVSPVRHIKDGFEESTLSKAHLLSAAHKTISSIKNVHYFPSYELMMDELRDYRFYKEDMLHPNETAIQYIWEKFKYVWVSSTTETTQKAVAIIQKGLQHRPFNSESEEYKEFKKELELKIEKITTQFPFMEF
jgi:hypothetical protein